MSIELFYAKVRKQLKEQLPFVIYRKGNTDIIQAFLQKNDTVFETKDYSDSGFVFAPFDNKNKAIIIPSSYSQYYEQVNQEIKGGKEENRDPETFLKAQEKDTTTEIKYQKLVTAAIEAISDDRFKKVVLSRNEKVNSPTDDAIQLFKRLLNTYRNAFVYLWYHPKIGTWLGATPETLIKIRNDNFFTMALAGTQEFCNTLDVHWGKKEIEEQKMVTSFVVNQLSSVVNKVECSKTYTHRAGTLLHLRTDISGVLNVDNSKIKDIIKVLHPTPAVCGLPKLEAKSFILSKEGYSRKFYTGFLGELNLGGEEKSESNIFVNLRCMELKEAIATLYIGGGITKDSDPEKEWEETVKKTETMKRVLF